MARISARHSLWHCTEQPARRAFGIDAVDTANGRLPVVQTDLYRHPFAVLTMFKAPDADRPRVLVVPPLSGHFPFLFRDLVLALLPDRDVAVLEWINARHVPAEEGAFTLDSNIGEAVTAIRHLAGETHVVGVCQGAVPALAATAILAQANDPAIPRSLVLIAAPIDPAANPTNVVRDLRVWPLQWFERYAFTAVGSRYPGAGRRVYPAQSQLTALMAYYTRHYMEHGLLMRKFARDDGADPARFPFADAFTSVMDLPASWFLDNVRVVFQERALARNTLSWRGQPVDLSAIETTALMTVEAERDDIAAPGQGAAAHALCPRLPAARHERYTLPGGSHFSTFHGETVRHAIAPRIRDLIARA